MAREYQNGDGFGYILAFRRKGTAAWSEVRIPHVESSRHVYYNQSLAPYTPFEVKIQAYNRKGVGPFSQTVEVHSAEEGGSMQIDGSDDSHCLRVCWLRSAVGVL